MRTLHHSQICLPWHWKVKKKKHGFLICSGPWTTVMSILSLRIVEETTTEHWLVFYQPKICQWCPFPPLEEMESPASWFLSSNSTVVCGTACREFCNKYPYICSVLQGICRKTVLRNYPNGFSRGWGVSCHCEYIAHSSLITEIFQTNIQSQCLDNWDDAYSTEQNIENPGRILGRFQS